MALFVLLLCPFGISVGIGAFVIGLGQISSFLSFQVRGRSVHRKYNHLDFVATGDMCVSQIRLVFKIPMLLPCRVLKFSFFIITLLRKNADINPR